MRNLFALGLTAVVFAAGFAIAADEPKYTIKEVMKATMGKDKLVSKVVDGKATDDEKKSLVEYAEALAAGKPKKGSDESWKKLTEAFLEAAKKADGKALKEAANCSACHKEHK